MRKLFLVCIAMGLLFTSCKNEESNNNESTDNPVSESIATDATDNNKTPVTDITMPEFSDPAVQEYANELLKYYHEIQAAEAANDKEKLEELVKQQVDYHQKQQEILKPLSTEEKEKFRNWSAEVARAALQ